MSGITAALRLQIWREQLGTCWYCDIPMEPPKSLKLDDEALVACVCLNCQLAHQGTPRVKGVMGINVVCIRGQLDHVVPRMFGGSDLRDNLVYACTVCNQARHLNDSFVDACRREHHLGHHPGEVPTGCELCSRAYAKIQGFASEREHRERVQGVLPPEVVAYPGRWVARHIGILQAHREVAATEPAVFAMWIEEQERLYRRDVINLYQLMAQEMWHAEWDSLLRDLFAAGYTSEQIEDQMYQLPTTKRTRLKGLAAFTHVHAALLREPREYS